MLSVYEASHKDASPPEADQNDKRNKIDVFASSHRETNRTKGKGQNAKVKSTQQFRVRTFTKIPVLSPS